VETAAAWKAHRDAFVAALAPVGIVEEKLAERVAFGWWRLARCERAETAEASALVEDARAQLVEDLPGFSAAIACARPAIEARREALARGEVPRPRTEDEREALAQAEAMNAKLDGIAARIVDVLALGRLDLAELRVRYETAAWKFTREAHEDLLALQAVRLANSRGAA
jgi:hypothetical protein